MYRFMSHLTYEIGRARRGPSASAPKRWSTTSGRDRSSTSCWRLSVRGRPGTPMAQSGWSAKSSLSALTISGSIHSPKPMPERLDLAGPARRARSAACAGRRTSRRARSCRRRAGRTSRRRGRTARRPSSRDAVAISSSFALVEVEVRALPVVDQHRARPVAPRAAGQPLAVQRGGRRRSGRRDPRPSRRGRPPGRRTPRPARAPRRSLRGRSRSGPGSSPNGVDLGLGEEVARVDEAEAVRLAVRPRWSPRGAGRGTGCAGRSRPRAGCRPTAAPGASRRSTTCRSRAQVPLSWTRSSRRRAGRAPALIASASRSGERPPLRIRRAAGRPTGRSRKIV